MSLNQPKKPKIGSFDSIESIFNEHKEFTLDPYVDTYKTSEYDENLLTDIINRIIHYVEKYFPKYFSTFRNTFNTDNNCDSNVKYGCLSFGITDNGYISGIPIKDYQYNKDYIYTQIKDTIHRLLTDGTIVYSDNYSSNGFSLSDIIIEITELKETDNSSPLIHEVNSFDTLIAKFEKENEEYQNAWAIWNITWNNWLKTINSYGCKMSEMLNSQKIRSEFIEYTLEKHTERIIQKIDLVADNNNLDDDLYDKVSISGYGEQDKVIVSNPIICLYLNYNDYDYILKEFRDVMRDKTLEYKPQRFYLKRPIDPRTYRLSRITPMIPEFIKDETITYILIKIKIKLVNCDIPIAYKSNNVYCVKQRLNSVVMGKCTPQTHPMFCHSSLFID